MCFLRRSWANDTKFTKLSKVGFSTEHFTVDSSQYCRTNVKNLPFERLGYLPSNTSVSEIIVKCHNFQRSSVICFSTTLEQLVHSPFGDNNLVPLLLW